MCPNFYVSNISTDPLYVSQSASNIIKYNSGTNLTWTPASGKSIYLTGIVLSATLALTTTLTRSSGGTFMVFSLSTTLNSISAIFSSPLVFNTNESITITTTANATLMGYEK